MTNLPKQSTEEIPRWFFVGCLVLLGLQTVCNKSTRFKDFPYIPSEVWNLSHNLESTQSTPDKQLNFILFAESFFRRNSTGNTFFNPFHSFLDLNKKSLQTIAFLLIKSNYKPNFPFNKIFERLWVEISVMWLHRNVFTCLRNENRCDKTIIPLYRICAVSKEEE